MSSLRVLLALVALVCLGAVSVSASCVGTTNSVPITDYNVDEATLLGSVANGTLHSVLSYNSTTPLLVAHVYGSPYSMGEAYGQLLKSQILEMMPQFQAWLSAAYSTQNQTVEEILDITIAATKAYTPQRHFDFLQGVSDGTGGEATFTDLLRIALVPEAIKATCSIAGAWGEATATGGLLQLRALDWQTDGPIQQWPLILNYHSNEDDAYVHTSVGWVGIYGTLTGFSSSNLAVSEKLWSSYTGIQNILGYPWTFMLQDIMRFDGDIDAAISRIASGPRTCSFWVGLGQGERPNPRNTNVTLPADFKLLGDSYQQVHVYNPENFPVYPPIHDYFPGLLFVDKQGQPSADTCMNDLFTANYGKLTADVFRETITPMEMTGDMHIAVFDFDAKQMSVANAWPLPNNVPAYNTGFVRFDMEDLWNSVSPEAELEETFEKLMLA